MRRGDRIIITLDEDGEYRWELFRYRTPMVFYRGVETTAHDAFEMALGHAWFDDEKGAK